MKQSSYPFSKTYFVLKFQPSRWTMAPSRPIFSFRSLNKLGPLVDNFKIALSDCAHTWNNPLTQVWLLSANFKDPFMSALIANRAYPIMLVYIARVRCTLANAKKKKWMPYGHQWILFFWVVALNSLESAADTTIVVGRILWLQKKTE